MPKPKHGCGCESAEEETPDFQWKGLILCGMLSPEGGGYHLVAGSLFFRHLGVFAGGGVVVVVVVVVMLLGYSGLLLVFTRQFRSVQVVYIDLDLTLISYQESGPLHLVFQIL